MQQTHALSAEQIALLSAYEAKWLAIATDTKPLNPTATQSTLELAYNLIQLAIPEILFSPDLASSFSKYLGLEHSLAYSRILEELLLKPLIENLQQQISRPIWGQIYYQIYPTIFLQIKTPKVAIKRQIREFANLQSNHGLNTTKGIKFGLGLNPEEWLGFCAIADFLIEIMGCSYDPLQWSIIRQLSEFIGWTFVTNRPHNSGQALCLVCDRPRFSKLPDIISNSMTWLPEGYLETAYRKSAEETDETEWDATIGDGID